MRIKYLS